MSEISLLGFRIQKPANLLFGVVGFHGCVGLVQGGFRMDRLKRLITKKKLKTSEVMMK